MRNAFADEITCIAEADERVVLLSGDIGNRLFDKFKERCPGRFLNCGVAEANMMGVAAGLALDGFRPFVYTIAPFVTTRCLEQIRDDVCYHKLPVAIVAVGAGLSYANLGATHQTLEDIAFLRSLPEMSVVCPADAREVRASLRCVLPHGGPIYLRMGKKGEPDVYESEPIFELGRAIELRAGTDACILTTGITASIALATADMLRLRGLSICVVHMPTVKPLDESMLIECHGRYSVIATIEEHGLIGGFGSAICEWRADTGHETARLLRFGAEDRFLHEATNQDHARHRYGLTAESVASALAEHLLQGRRGVA